MSFHLITGLMGGGKSYLAVEACKKAAEEGAIVHTNLPLVQEEWEALGLWEKIVILPREPTKWIRFEKRDIDGEETDVPCSDCITGGAEGLENIVVFDEASIVFRTKDQTKNKDKHQPVFDLIALSRHVGLEIMFIAQHEDNISADLRRLAELRTKCIKTEKIPMIGWIAAPLLGDFCRVVYRGLAKDPFVKSYHRFSMAVGRLYKTHGMAESVAMRVDPTRKAKGMDTSKRKGILLFVVAPLLCILVAGLALWKAKTRLIDDPKAAAAHKEAGTPDLATNTDKGDKPQEKSKTVSRGGWRLMEWDVEDELVFGTKIESSKGVVVYARGGQRLGVGLNYLGEPIVEYVSWGGWHYFRTQFGRLVVVRPLMWSEREELPPVTVQGQTQSNRPDDELSSPLAPLEEGMKGVIKTIKGT